MDGQIGRLIQAGSGLMDCCYTKVLLGVNPERQWQEKIPPVDRDCGGAISNPPCMKIKVVWS